MFKTLFLLGLLAVTVKAEVGAECAIDADCGNAAEFCKHKMKAEMMEMEGAGEGNAIAMEDMASMGMCMMKHDIYMPCVRDTMCIAGTHCMRMPIPGVHPLMKGHGVCVECSKDTDCAGDQFCNHPVLNAACMESVMLGAFAKKMKGSPGSEESSSHGSSESSHGDDKGLQMIIKAVVAGLVSGDKDGKGDGKDHGPRERRGLGHFVINNPDMMCHPKRPVSAPCKRSPACQSGKCSMEGQCLT